MASIEKIDEITIKLNGAELALILRALYNVNRYEIYDHEITRMEALAEELRG